MAITKKGVKGGYVTLLFNATGFTNIASANAVGETVDSMNITHMLWSANGASKWTVARGGNTIASLYGVDDWDLSREGIQLEQGGDAASNLVATLSSTSGLAEGTLIIKLHKKSSGFTTEY
tara:strand:+ start:1169 stop:1531 length:363 start_codon:yes stop_codon:yes gene_type:complete